MEISDIDGDSEQVRAHGLVLAIKGLPGGAVASVGELAGRLRLKHHSVVELIDHLENITKSWRRLGRS